MENQDPCVPPGFRFHPTEEELVGYYLRRKINSLTIDLDVIVDIDLYRIEPWDIQDRCKLGYAGQNEWYFFSHKDKKYPTGTRTNRATAAGFWKATGRDKAVLSKEKIIGMRKTLVYYKGRAPNGKKSDWIMHEYRLETSQHAPPQEEGWVVCRAFKKPSPSTQRPYGFNPFWQNQNPNYYMQMMRANNPNGTGSPSSLPDLMSPNSMTMDSSYGQPPMTPYHHHNSVQPPFEFDQQGGPSENRVVLDHQEGFVDTTQDGNYLYEDEYKSTNTNWKFLDSLLACDQMPSTSSMNMASSQMDSLDEYQQVLDPEHLNDQGGDFLTCFTNL